MLRMAILDDYQGAAPGLADWHRIADRVEIVSLREHHAAPQHLVAALRDFDILFAMRERSTLNAAVIEGLPRLKLIVTAGPLNAAIDVKVARERGIVVSGTGFNSRSTVELTWALILNVFRNIQAEVESVRSGGWQVGLGADLRGKTIGIVGLGNTGQQVARVAQAFGMSVIAWSQNMTPQSAAQHGATMVEKSALFRSADVVTVHLRLSDRTRGLIGVAELGSMKPTAYLINTSRGPIVDEDALGDALRHGTIAGAGVDVFSVEPLPQNHPFRSLPNMIATPHIGYVSSDLYGIFYRHAIEDVEAWLDGRPIRRVLSYDEAGAGLPDWVTADLRG